MTEEPPPPEDRVRHLDPRSLRGLAHPLRIRLLGALREHGPATASQLAARLGESSGATSYHLRQLAAHDWVEDDPERGTARERWWKAAYRGTRVDKIEEFIRHPDAEVRGAMNTYVHEHATIHAQDLANWLGTMHEWPLEWQTAWTMSDAGISLTPALAMELNEKLTELVESYRGVADGAEGTEKVRYQIHSFPRRSDPEDPTP